MRAFALSLTLIPSLLAAQSPPLPLKYTPRPTSAAISAGDLMSRLYVFADDSMMGRETGTRGHVMSTDYIARELRRLGLEPAGDNKTYFQSVPMVNRPFDVARSSLSVNGATLAAGTDFVPQTFRGMPRAIDGATVIFCGTYGDTAGLPTAEQLRGKIVVFADGRGFGAGALGGAVWGAAAIARVASPRMLAQTLRTATWPTANQAMRLAVPPADAPLTIHVSDRAAEALLGVPLAQATRGMVGKRVRGAIVFAETRAPARNVVAILRGRDPRLRNTYVALGAHSDHVGLTPDAIDHDSARAYDALRAATLAGVPAALQGRPEVRARLDSIRVNLDSVHRLRPARRDSIRNGADDDGSGSMVLLELAEAFAKAATKPRRSLLFVWHTAEEKGLLGSRWYAENSTVPRDSIVAQLNMDMVGRGEASDFAGGGPTYLSLVGSHRLSSELGDTVESVNRRQPRPFVIDYSWDAPGHPQNIYCRSDHFNYARWGIPVVFAWTALHGDYHEVTDEPQYISYDHMARVANLMHDVTANVANMSRRPTVDGQRMNPTGRCQQ
ncbi:MAG: M28 family peptidase [Gemmatimonadaceae bacterium]